MSIIQEHWDKNELLGINSITFSDNKIVLLHCYKSEINNIYAYPLCDTTIVSLKKYNQDQWTQIQVLASARTEVGDTLYLAGEGGMGNEGFIAATTLSNRLKWAIFFENSNPFCDIRIDDKIVLATTNCKTVYKIELHAIPSINVEKL